MSLNCSRQKQEAIARDYLGLDNWQQVKSLGDVPVVRLMIVMNPTLQITRF
ncbi:hypothetical protein [Nostoc sp. FACHB-133]|uniref:hypothetical protein n=1 Tax=Nostoc sp. FACHB-133 TaxID=2692835 RepID=UPI001684A04F|nr:hypothetical protein [Nostoc sp. FACHB-133]